MKSLTCDLCGTCISTLDPGALYSRGYWWHVPCATMRAPGMVAFPSRGKLMPDTIISYYVPEGKEPTECNEARAALKELMPFVLEDYYPACAMPAYVHAVERAKACIADDEEGAAK